VRGGTGLLPANVPGVRRGYHKPIYVPRPLLGKYLFVEVVIAEWGHQFHRIVAVRGIAGILTKGEKPMVAREHEVQRIRDSEVHGYVPTPTKIRFVRDQRVRICRGPFVGHDARFKRERGVLDVVEIELFGARGRSYFPLDP
jgi:transcription antitermination factor NusG